MRSIPLIPAGIWKSSSMPVIGAGESPMRLGVEDHPGSSEWQQARQPRAVFAGSNANKLNRLGAAFSCKVSDPAFVVGMRSIPLIPAGIREVEQHAGHWRGLKSDVVGVEPPGHLMAASTNSHELYSLGPTRTNSTPEAYLPGTGWPINSKLCCVCV